MMPLTRFRRITRHPIENGSGAVLPVRLEIEQRQPAFHVEGHGAMLVGQYPSVLVKSEGLHE
jgi:hypothetical protein